MSQCVSLDTVLRHVVHWRFPGFEKSRPTKAPVRNSKVVDAGKQERSWNQAQKLGCCTLCRGSGEESKDRQLKRICRWGVSK